MPVYNGEKYIREAIDSILQQTYPFMELILIKDFLFNPVCNLDRIERTDNLLAMLTTQTFSDLFKIPMFKIRELFQEYTFIIFQTFDLL